jgi:hypothetical protein
VVVKVIEGVFVDMHETNVIRVVPRFEEGEKCW